VTILPEATADDFGSTRAEEEDDNAEGVAEEEREEEAGRGVDDRAAEAVVAEENDNCELMGKSVLRDAVECRIFFLRCGTMVFKSFLVLRKKKKKKKLVEKTSIK
jgi:hypothetical protein